MLLVCGHGLQVRVIGTKNMIQPTKKEKTEILVNDTTKKKTQSI